MISVGDKSGNMKNTTHLRNLGDEALKIESIYLNLKIEKALTGDQFRHDALLAEAEKLWKDINEEYYSFLGFLQSDRGLAA